MMKASTIAVISYHDKHTNDMRGLKKLLHEDVYRARLIACVVGVFSLKLCWLNADFLILVMVCFYFFFVKKKKIATG